MQSTKKSFKLNKFQWTTNQPHKISTMRIDFEWLWHWQVYTAQKEANSQIPFEQTIEILLLNVATSTGGPLLIDANWRANLYTLTFTRIHARTHKHTSASIYQLWCIEIRKSITRSWKQQRNQCSCLYLCFLHCMCNWMQLINTVCLHPTAFSHKLLVTDLQSRFPNSASLVDDKDLSNIFVCLNLTVDKTQH